MKDFLYKLTDFVRDEGGRLSSMRLLFLVWGVGTLVVWAYLSIKAAAFISGSPENLRSLDLEMNGEI